MILQLEMRARSPGEWVTSETVASGWQVEVERQAAEATGYLFEMLSSTWDHVTFRREVCIRTNKARTNGLGPQEILS